VADKSPSYGLDFIQYPPIRNIARGMGRYADTRPDRPQYSAKQLELRATRIATTRRAGDSEVCATNLDMDIRIRANSTQLSLIGSRVQEEVKRSIEASRR